MAETHSRESRTHGIPTELVWGLGFLSLWFVLELLLSLRWRVVHDTALLHYVALLVDRFDYVPYRDVFETSTPGTLLFHVAIGKLFGYGDVAFRVVDVLWLLGLLGVTWRILEPLSKQVAWAGTVLFGLSYLQFGAAMSLQRDYVGVSMVAAAVLVCLSRARLRGWVRALLVGLLFGGAVTIKPHLGLGLPFVLVDLCRRGEEPFLRACLRFVPIVALSFAIPIVVCLSWLQLRGGLGAFQEMLFSYLPLHLELTGTHTIVTGAARWSYLFDSYRELGGLAIWLVPATLALYTGVFRARKSQANDGRIALLGTLTLVYSFYPAIAGQFWSYHWMPFQYFVILLASCALVPQAGRSWKHWVAIAALLLAVLRGVHVPPGFSEQLRGRSVPAPRGGRVDEIADYLKRRAAPADKAQPLDWSGGAVHALLLAKVPLATPYVYDYHFYHHVSDPVVQEIRKRFMKALNANPPRFVIEVVDKPMVRGHDTTYDFPELRGFLQQGYEIAHLGDGFGIYERRETPLTP